MTKINSFLKYSKMKPKEKKKVDNTNFSITETLLEKYKPGRDFFIIENDSKKLKKIFK